MKSNLLVIITAFLLLSCNSNIEKENVFVENIKALKFAIINSKPGDEIVLKNGVWTDAQIKFFGFGTKENPIILRAETPGKVFLEGQSFIHLGGENLIVDGFYFRNGYSPTSIIKYMINKDSIAYNTRVTNTVIEGFNKPSRLINDRWIEFFGKHNKLDHCYISGKSNDGETLRVFFTANEHINNHHQIVNNYFGPRPRKGGPRAETIRVGDSKTRFAPGFVNISNNYFDACNGEVEIISDKTNFNLFAKNIFYKCEGSLVLRHSNYATVNANIFIGGDDSDFYGGIRAVNTGHWITNNYLYKIKGGQFRSPLAIMNGIPMTPLNRYKQVADVVVAYNTWVDCKSPWQIGVGQNIESASVLPVSEIRSASPIRTTIANNIIYNTEADKYPIVNHDDMSGINFKNNIIDNNGFKFSEYDIVNNKKVKMKQINEWLFAPSDLENESLNDVFIGYEFDKIKYDLFGTKRADVNKIGAINQLNGAEKFKIDKKKYGPKWFNTEVLISEPRIYNASSEDGVLVKIIAQASSGDIIELNSNEIYTIKKPLKIDKKIILKSKGDIKAKIIYNGTKNSPLFEMNPNGFLDMENISIRGNNTQLAFAPLDKNMSTAYNLNIDNCKIEKFKYILKASKGSFADTMKFKNTTFTNCENGFVLAADEKGDYNAEMVTFTNCKFNKISKNIIHFYRGGYDESTIGGVFSFLDNTISQSGNKEKSGVLLKTRGIINVNLSRNIFRDNPIKLVALLWGVKNNTHSNNKIINSGIIKVEEQQKLKILY